MQRQLFAVLLAPSLVLVGLVAFVAVSANLDANQAAATAHTAELARLAAELDAALGAETIGAADAFDRLDYRIVFGRSDAALAAVVTHAELSKTTQGHTAAAVDVIALTLARRGDATNGTVSPLQIGDRYGSARGALRDAIEAEAILANPDRPTRDLSILLDLVNARGAHVDERLAVSLAIRYETWAPGQYGVVVGAIERQEAHLDAAFQAQLMVPLEVAPELDSVRNGLKTTGDLPTVDRNAWRAMSSAWSQQLDAVVEQQARQATDHAEQAARQATTRLMLTLGVGIAAVLGAMGVSWVLTLRGARRTRLGTSAMQSIAEGRPLDETLALCSQLLGRTGRFELRSDPSGDTVVYVGADGKRRGLDDPELDDGGKLQLAVKLAQTAERRTGDAADLQRRADRDDLTGLLNRASLLRTIDELRAASTADGQFGVLFMDLDGFKAVNDGWGHDRGDELLVAIAEQLELVAVHHRAVVGRMGGDEFVVAVPHALERDLASIGRQIVEAVIRTSLRLGHEVGASVGAAHSRIGLSADGMLKEADIAMYVAKVDSVVDVVVSGTGERPDAESVR